MTVRTLRKSDIPMLMGWHATEGYEYVFPDYTSNAFEVVHVVVDEDDQPVVSAGAERILQLYLQCRPGTHALVKKRAIQLLHESLAPALREKGYSEINAFPPPHIADLFGKRLMKTWNWVKNWPSFCVRF